MSLQHLASAALLSAMVVLLGLSPALSQSTVSQSDQDACTPDVFRLCQSYIPDETAIVACLQAKRQELSPACHQVFYPAPATSEPQKVRHRHQAKRHHSSKAH